MSTEASGSQAKLSQEETDAYTSAQQMTQERYGDQQAIYGPMAAQFSKIFAAGPDTTGFSAPELQTLNSQAIEGTAENFKGAAKAVGSEEAAEGGGTTPLEGGEEQEQKENLSESSAAEESKEETGITEADYQQGENNWENAGKGLETIAAGENPIGSEEAEAGLGKVANDESNELAKEENSWETAAIGAGAGLAGDALDTFGA